VTFDMLGGLLYFDLCKDRSPGHTQLPAAQTLDSFCRSPFDGCRTLRCVRSDRLLQPRDRTSCS
jgi:hypothetical protein